MRAAQHQKPRGENKNSGGKKCVEGVEKNKLDMYLLGVSISHQTQ